MPYTYASYLPAHQTAGHLKPPQVHIISEYIRHQDNLFLTIVFHTRKKIRQQYNPYPTGHQIANDGSYLSYVIHT
eukprot:scaffold212210_cov17-Tisochrysis_lutea.AAC.3